MAVVLNGDILKPMHTMDRTSYIQCTAPIQNMLKS
jgi:hypothetical protein